jgi:hypothetical protein
MIKEIQKDITTIERGIALHQVNAMGVMSSGVALAIKNKWPVVFDAYHRKYLEKSNKPWELLGDAQIVECSDNIHVVNLFSQYDFGYNGQRYTEYAALSSALKNFNISVKYWELHRYSKTEFPLKIYIPYKMGCDRGGGDWNIVYDMIETILDNDDRTIYICRL